MKSSVTRLSGKPVAEAIQQDVLKRTQAFTAQHGRTPNLCVVIVGEDPASLIYTRRKGEAASALGMSHKTVALSKDATPSQVKAIIDQLNADPGVDGILIQRPLPAGFSEEEVLYWVTPEKDVDAFHPINGGRLYLGLPALQPCTPSGIMRLLAHYNIDVAGKTACVVGRSNIVGKPMAVLLTRANATVIQCHSKTRNLQAMTQQAEILVVAAGKPGLIDEACVREGAVVIDVGIHRTAEGKLVGDVNFDSASKKASAISPVPGGVGLMTIAVLMQNTIDAAERRAQKK